ncbi:MAG TPA: peptidoglycan editing factor PgeF [Bryobacteraceae bacterium]|nr:peptidoglycan editing factor PgeF [Bryobacteraceae bacterium]
MFYRDALEVYRARPLDAFAWLAHGFGTRGSAAFGNGNLATLRQIHSSRCLVADGKAGCLGEGDALLEQRPGILVGVKTADCFPILLVDERRRAVAAVHAGWRGVAKGIVKAAIEQMARVFSTCPEDVHAAIGPGIGACCYEVGPEVAGRFGIQSCGPVKLDLADQIRTQLLQAGVAAERMYLAGLCTRCHPEEFHSYRRDAERAGRMYSVVGIR